jgi:hypothetical protein
MNKNGRGYTLFPLQGGICPNIASGFTGNFAGCYKATLLYQ